MAEALLGLGANLGDARKTLDTAVKLLCDGDPVRLLARSSDYRTAPWGVEDQPYFINLCIAVETDLLPHDLLARAQAVERTLGRERTTERRWGPRPVDIDLLAYNGVTLQTAQLTLPHPRLLERAWAELSRDFSGLITGLAARGFRGPFATADARVVHNAGGSEAQEIAYAVAVGIEYLRALTAAGVGLDAARSMIYFRLSADSDQFLTLAKFRAIRKLWARVEQACGLAAAPAFVAAETAWRMMSKRDPHVNILRSTIAVASAAWGGADAITVLPFTMARGLPDRFARRIARNTQLVLIEESGLARVADPAAGSGGMEDLTDQLSRAAWLRVQQIEKAGGAWAALQQGDFQRDVAAVREQRRNAVALRKHLITGTSDFANVEEQPVSTLDIVPSWPSLRPLRFPCEPLAPIRLAEPFEALRDASDQMLASSGARPKVFLANLGKLSDFGARATFASNLFEAGGIEASGNDGFAGCEEVIAAFKRSGASLACLCSSDQIYARDGVASARALREAGAKVWLAGTADSLAPALEGAGVSRFIFAGCDVLAALQAAHALLVT